MPFTQQDELYMVRALELARAAVGLASPNPAVGCVLVRDGELLGEGAHHYDDYDHAEIVALKQAAARGLDVRGATAYVTLEPCSFHGRTGPCADALVRAEIARCVVATVDPHPKVSGAGIARMLAAGVDVVVAGSGSSVALQARRLNDAFAFSVRHDRPFVTLKAAVSLDGKLAPSPAQRVGRAPVWLTGDAARADVQLLRHANDAIVTGIGTVLADDPLLTDRSGLLRRRPLLRVVLDSELRMPSDSKMVASAVGDLLVVMTDHADVASEAKLVGQGIEVMRLDADVDGRVDLVALLRDLHRRHIRSVMIEGGSAINGAFLRAGLVDRVVLYISETELGMDAVPFAQGQTSPYALQEQLSSVTRDVFRNGVVEDIRIMGYLRDPWALI